MEHLKQFVRDVPDFPKKGIMFKDISPLLENHFSETIVGLHELVKHLDVEAILGVEARGFIVGAALAKSMNIGFIPARKKNKLPPPVVSQEYTLEYGTDTLELAYATKKLKVLIADDVLATGGTFKATYELAKKTGHHVLGGIFLMNLEFLNAPDIKELSPIYSLLHY
jgi:adenine phosphoribosyltransferase